MFDPRKKKKPGLRPQQQQLSPAPPVRPHAPRPFGGGHGLKPVDNQEYLRQQGKSQPGLNPTGRPEPESLADKITREQGGIRTAQSSNTGAPNIVLDGTNVAVPVPYSTATGPSSLDEEFEAWLRERLGEGVDTEEAERIAREQSERALGAGLADMNARASWGGLGLTGAVGAIEGDMRSRSGLELADQLLGIRDRARQEEFGRGITIGDFLDRGTGREWGAEQAGTDRDWRTGEAEKDRDWRTGESEKDRASRDRDRDDDLAFMNASLAEQGAGYRFERDEDGNLVMIEEEPEDALTISQNQKAEDARKKERYSGTESSWANGAGLPWTGDEQVDEYRNEDGTRVLIIKRPDGTLYKFETGQR